MSISKTDLILHSAAVELDLEEAQQRNKELEDENKRLRELAKTVVDYVGLVHTEAEKEQLRKDMLKLAFPIKLPEQPKEQP